MPGVFPVGHSTLSAGAIATDVLPHYALGPSVDCRLLARGMNDTYRVDAGDARYVVRAYRAGVRSRADVLFELEALLHLKAGGVAVANPIPRGDGALVHAVAAPEGERFLVLFAFAPGTRLAAEERDFADYGRLVAQIHAATSTFGSRHARAPLDLRHLLDEPLAALGPLLAHRAEDRGYLASFAERLRARLHELPLERLEEGFCHGDVNWNNVHVDAERTFTMLDFDCCGAGWRAYDLAVFRWVARTRRAEETAWPAFLRGYQEERALAEVDLRAVDDFVAARHLWVMGMHAASAPCFGYGQVEDAYFDRAVSFLRRWEAERLAP